jgi:hypothetical protein
MKKYNNIYCTSDNLNEILLFPHEYIELFKLVKICNVIVELNDKEMEGLITLSEPTPKNIQLHSFFKEKFTFHNNNSGIFQIFYNDEKIESEIENISNDIFIINLSEQECESIRIRYGLFVISSQNKDYIKKFNQPPDGWSWEKGETILTDPITNQKIQISEWKNLFSGLEVEKIIPPYNSIIINDQYLFAEFHRSPKLISNNLQSLIEGLLPRGLCIEFNVLLVFGSSKTERSKEGKEEFKIYLSENEIKSTLTNLQSWAAKFKPQKLSFSIITIDINKQKGFHSRAIYFNHGISISNYGFTHFLDGKPQKENDLNMKWSYNSINTAIFNIMPIHKMITFKNKIKDLIKLEKQVNNTFKFMNSNNRLLNF